MIVCIREGLMELNNNGEILKLKLIGFVDGLYWEREKKFSD